MFLLMSGFVDAIKGVVDYKGSKFNVRTLNPDSVKEVISELEKLIAPQEVNEEYNAFKYYDNLSIEKENGSNYKIMNNGDVLLAASLDKKYEGFEITANIKIPFNNSELEIENYKHEITPSEAVEAINNLFKEKSITELSRKKGLMILEGKRGSDEWLSLKIQNEGFYNGLTILFHDLTNNKYKISGGLLNGRCEFLINLEGKSGSSLKDIFKGIEDYVDVNYASEMLKQVPKRKVTEKNGSLIFEYDLMLNPNLIIKKGILSRSLNELISYFDSKTNNLVSNSMEVKDANQIKKHVLGLNDEGILFYGRDDEGALTELVSLTEKDDKLSVKLNSKLEDKPRLMKKLTVPYSLEDGSKIEFSFEGNAGAEVMLGLKEFGSEDLDKYLPEINGLKEQHASDIRVIINGEKTTCTYKLPEKDKRQRKILNI